MGLADVEEFFVNSTDKGLYFPFFTIRHISKHVQNDSSNVRKCVSLLVEKGAVKEHPFNKMFHEKRYQLDKNYYVKNYLLDISQLSFPESSSD